MTLVERLEQRDVQLAGCATAAQGHVGPEQVAKPGDYGWSPAYQDVVELRRRVDNAESALASLADTVNQELRESGEFNRQAELGQDLRPFVLRLVDLNRVRGVPR